MTRRRIKIKKIDNIAARQVTFSKRRRGLFKKAHELALLCDADVALIVFSSTGKLFDFASSSMRDILQKYYISNPNGTDDEKTYQFPSLQLQQESHILQEKLKNEISDKKRDLRHIRGEELGELSMKELEELEKRVQSGLTSVSLNKDKRIKNEIVTLQNKGAQLIEENKQLKQQVEKMDNERKFRVVIDINQMIIEDDHHIPESNNIASTSHMQNTTCNYLQTDCSDTSLKLGLPFQ